MKLRPELLFAFLLFSCIYDPPQKGKEISIHNQTDKPIVILDSLNGDYRKLYDTAKVNGRIFISRRPNYLTEYGVYQKFYFDLEMDNLKTKGINKIKLYIIDSSEQQKTLSKISINHSFRSFDINIDTLKKYDLNHLFISKDTILFEHDFNYFTNWKH